MDIIWWESCPLTTVDVVLTLPNNRHVCVYIYIHINICMYTYMADIWGMSFCWSMYLFGPKCCDYKKDLGKGLDWE